MTTHSQLIRIVVDPGLIDAGDVSEFSVGETLHGIGLELPDAGGSPATAAPSAKEGMVLLQDDPFGRAVYQITGRVAWSDERSPETWVLEVENTLVAVYSSHGRPAEGLQVTVRGWIAMAGQYLWEVISSAMSGSGPDGRGGLIVDDIRLCQVAQDNALSRSPVHSARQWAVPDRQTNLATFYDVTVRLVNPPGNQ